MIDWLMKHAGWGFVIGIAILAVYGIGLDVLVNDLNGVRFTISRQTQAFSLENPIAPALAYYAIGVITVHLFLVRSLPFFDSRQPLHAAALGLLLGGLTAWAFWLQRVE